MPVRVGNTAITAIGKVKLGTTNITKIFRGTTQIWPNIIVYSFREKSLSSTTGAGACALVNTTNGAFRYSNVEFPIVGTVLYTDNTLTTPMNGNNDWYIFNNAFTGTSYRINTSGVVTETFDCGF